MKNGYETSSHIFAMNNLVSNVQQKNSSSISCTGFHANFSQALDHFQSRCSKKCKESEKNQTLDGKSFLLQPQKNVLNFKTKRKKKMHWWLFTSHTKSVCKEICILLQLCTLSILPLFQNYKGQCAFFVLIEL